MFRPKVVRMDTPIKLQKRIVADVNGSDEISYSDFESDPLAFCNWKGKGGTEALLNGNQVVMDTAQVTTWYRPDISEKDRVLLRVDDNLCYEIQNVENVEMANQMLILKVIRVVVT